MKYTTIGCLIGVLLLLSLVALQAQDTTLPLESQTPIEPINTIEATIEPSQASEIISPATEPALPTAELVIEATDVVSPESTAEMTALPLPDPLETLPSSDANATVSPSQIPRSVATLALRMIEGKVLYPNRVFGQAFTRVQAYAPDNTLLSTVYTDATGRYTLVVPADQVTRIEINAPLYLQEMLFLAPGLIPDTLTLRGGDLDSDACVGKADIEILVRHYGGTFVGADLDGSGIVDVIDLTLLSANYDDTCLPAIIVPTPTSPVPVATAESISTEDATELPAPTESLATQEPLPTVEALATDEPTLPPLPTDTSIPIEATAEATLQS